MLLAKKKGGVGVVGSMQFLVFQCSLLSEDAKDCARERTGVTLKEG